MNNNQAAQIGYKKDDIVAAQKLLSIHLAKMDRAIQADNFAEVCSALRAIENECSHAMRIAATLSFKARNTQLTPRISRGNLLR